MTRGAKSARTRHFDQCNFVALCFWRPPQNRNLIELTHSKRRDVKPFRLVLALVAIGALSQSNCHWFAIIAPATRQKAPLLCGVRQEPKP